MAEHAQTSDYEVLRHGAFCPWCDERRVYSETVGSEGITYTSVEETTEIHYRVYVVGEFFNLSARVCEYCADSPLEPDARTVFGDW